MHSSLALMTLPARSLRLSDARSARMLGVRRAGMSTDATPPTPQPEPMSERILTFMQRVCFECVPHKTFPCDHKLCSWTTQVVVTGLAAVSVAGLAFIAYGSWEIYDRAQQRKRIKAKQAAERVAES